MKVLVAHKINDIDAAHPGDFNWVPDGEIVHEGIVVCCNSDYCGCNRALDGIITHKGTTTAVVAERDLTDEDVAALGRKAGEETGFGEFAAAALENTLEAIKDFPVGALVRVAFDFDNEVWTYTATGEES